MDERCLECHGEIQSQFGDPTTLHGILTQEMDQFTCRECHTDHNGSEAGLTLATITDFPHEMVGFALEGHQTTDSGAAFACADCQGEEIAHFEPGTCSECHLELDQSFMEAHQATFGGECLACHDGLDTYGDSFDHQSTAFALTGMHEQVACAGCHEGARNIADLQAAPTQCYDCHAKDDAHTGQMGTDCETCHVTEGWEQASFDHSETGFVLIGEHAEVSCTECHADLTFSQTPNQCIDCHVEDDIHAGKFGVECGTCHTPEGWEEVNFDHALTAFPLTGKHVEVECTECHVNEVFAGTAQECAACHEEPQFHAGLFSVNCAECHTTEGWSPAQFSGAHIFPISHGEAGASSCRTCHASSLAAYTCYGCHEHTPENIAGEHLKEGINNFDNCIACHPTGLKDEAEGGDDD
jgi:hypothetical protein